MGAIEVRQRGPTRKCHAELPGPLPRRPCSTSSCAHSSPPHCSASCFPALHSLLLGQIMDPKMDSAMAHLASNGPAPNASSADSERKGRQPRASEWQQHSPQQPQSGGGGRGAPFRTAPRRPSLQGQRQGSCADPRQLLDVLDTLLCRTGQAPPPAYRPDRAPLAPGQSAAPELRSGPGLPRLGAFLCLQPHSSGTPRSARRWTFWLEGPLSCAPARAACPSRAATFPAAPPAAAPSAAEQALWFAGHSLPQTLFSCVYLLSMGHTQHNLVLHAFCGGRCCPLATQCGGLPSAATQGRYWRPGL